MEQTHDTDNFTKLTQKKYDISVKEDHIFNTVSEPDHPYFYILREGIPVDVTGKEIINERGNFGYYYSTDKGIVLLAKGRTLTAPPKTTFIEHISTDPNEKVFVFYPYGTLPDNPIIGDNIPNVILSKNEINEHLQLITRVNREGGSRRSHNYKKYNKYNNRGKSANSKRGSTTRRALNRK